MLALGLATAQLASAALAHLSAARALTPRLPRGAPPCLLQAVGVSRYLSLLEKAGFDPLTAEEELLGAGSSATASRHRAALAVETRWRGWRGTF